MTGRQLGKRILEYVIPTIIWFGVFFLYWLFLGIAMGVIFWDVGW